MGLRRVRSGGEVERERKRSGFFVLQSWRAGASWPTFWVRDRQASLDADDGGWRLKAFRFTKSSIVTNWAEHDGQGGRPRCGFRVCVSSKTPPQLGQRSSAVDCWAGECGGAFSFALSGRELGKSSFLAWASK